jgi:phosphatidylglycerophosphate synthase
MAPSRAPGKSRFFSLRKNIVLLVGSLFLLQTAIFAAILLAYGIDLHELLVFTGVDVLYHAGLSLFLVLRSEDFRIDGAAEPLKKVNLANILTIIRLSSIPSALFLILLSRRIELLPVALPYLGIVFITDFFDGMTARMRGELTIVGRYLDSVSDYLIIIATSIIFYSFTLIPLWFFLLIIARLVLFAFGMGVAALKQGKARPMSTFFGKASIFATMWLYLMEVAE